MIMVKFDQGEQMLYIHNEGSTSIDEIVKTVSDYFRNDKLPHPVRILEFVTADFMRGSVNEWNKFEDNLKVWIRKFSSVRHAVICHDPFVVAKIILLEPKIKPFNYTINVFSTEAVARHWLSEN